MRGSMVVIPLAHTGFGASAEALVRRFLDTDTVVTLYGHPFQALDSTRAENSEHADQLDRLLANLEPERASGKLTFSTMAEVEAVTRGFPSIVPVQLCEASSH
jgi:6-phosphogluconate dehydrogenase (decarboxylating)